MPNNNTIFKTVEETYYIYNTYQITSHSFFKKSFSMDLIRFEISANFVQMHLFTEKVYYK